MFAVFFTVLTELIHQRKQAMLWFPVFLGIGIAIYFSLQTEPHLPILITLLIIGLTLVAIACLWAHPLRWLFVLCAWVILGVLVSSLRTNLVSAPILGWRYYGTMTGTVIGIDRSSKDRIRLTLTDLSIGKISAPRTPKKIRISLYGKTETYEGRLGDIVRIEGSISPPSGPTEPDGFSFQRRAWFSQLGAVGYTRKNVAVIGEDADSSLKRWIYEKRLSLSRVIHKKVGDANGGFASAILTGDRSFIDSADLESLRRSNLAHLLAISGLHMGLLVGFVFALVRYGMALFAPFALRLPLKKIAAVVALGAGAFYLVLSGMSIATTRAFIMVAVMLSAILLDRPALSLRAVGLAATLILLVHPENLLGVGFQMSFAATIALIAAFRGFKRMGLWMFVDKATRQTMGAARDDTGIAAYITQILRGFLSLVLASLIAGLATAPFSAYHFNQIAHYGLLANLLSVPVMGTLIMPSAIIAGFFALIGLEALPLWVMGQGIGWILFVAEQVSALPGANSRVPAGGQLVMVLLVFGSVMLILFRQWFRVIGIAVLLAGFAVWMNATRPAMLVSDSGRLVGVLDDGLRGLNRAKGHGFIAQNWLENDGDNRTQDNAVMAGVDVDDFDVRLGGVAVKYLWDGKVSEEALRRLCTDYDVLIAPKWKEDTGLFGGCRFFGYYDFIREGAVAFYLDTSDGLRIRTGRDSIGVRLWSPLDRRRKWKKRE